MKLIADRTNSESTCGLDIGTNELKIVQLKSPKQHSIAISASSTDLTTSTFRDGYLADINEFKQSVTKLLSNAKPNPICAQQVVVALPESFVHVAVLDLPILTLKQTERKIKSEFGKHLPITLKQSYFDFITIEYNQSTNRQRTVLFAADKTNINQLSKVLEDIGLRVTAVESKSTAAARALIAHTEPETVLVVDIRPKTTLAFIFDGGSAWQSQTVEFGIEKITRSISEQLNLPVFHSLNDLGHINLSLLKTDNEQLLQLVQTAHDVIDKHESLRRLDGNNIHPVSRILVTGEGSLMPLIENYLFQKLKTRCEIAHPLIANSEVLPAGFEVAIGLAMRRG